jgi:hypothetical protein
MLQALNVFLDAQVFFRENFGFSSRRFRRLCELASDYRLSFYATELVFREIDSGIVERVRNAGSTLQKAAKPDNAGILRHCSAFPFDHLFSFPEDEVLQDFRDQFSRFVQSARLGKISIASTSTAEVFDRYFSLQPPFQEGKKRNEFPDAFSLCAISRWCHENQTTAYVISSDSDWRSFCANDDRLFGLNSIDELLDLVASEDILAERARMIYADSQGVIHSAVKEQFEGLGFFLDDQNGDVEDVSVLDVETLGEFLLSLDEHTAVFGVDFIVRYTAWVTYEDPDFGYYDNEDHSYYSMRTIRKGIDRKADFLGEVLIDLEQAKLDRVIFSSSDDIAVTVDPYERYK